MTKEINRGFRRNTRTLLRHNYISSAARYGQVASDRGDKTYDRPCQLLLRVGEVDDVGFGQLDDGHVADEL